MPARSVHRRARPLAAAPAFLLPQWGAPLALLDGPRVGYIEALERNTHIVYPALTVLVVLLIGLGIVQAIRSEGLSAVTKAEIKRRVLHALRRNNAGLSAKELARLLSLPTPKVGKLLEEMSDDALIEETSDEQGFSSWQLTEAERLRQDEAKARRERNRRDRQEGTRGGP